MKQKWTGFQLCMTVALAAGVLFFSGCHQEPRSTSPFSPNQFIELPDLGLMDPGASCIPGSPDLVVTVARYVGSPQKCRIIFYNLTSSTQYIYPASGLFHETFVSCVTTGDGHGPGGLSLQPQLSAPRKVDNGVPVAIDADISNDMGLANCVVGGGYSCLFWNNSVSPVTSCTGLILQQGP